MDDYEIPKIRLLQALIRTTATMKSLMLRGEPWECDDDKKDFDALCHRIDSYLRSEQLDAMGD